MKVLAVSGSLRADSYNTSLLRAAIEAAPEGVEVELFDPAGLAGLPLYDQDLDTGEASEPVARLREEWGSADAILFATPEYNGSVPGGLKNAIDWASRPRPEAAPHEQDGRRRRRQHRSVRRDVGAGRPAQDPRRGGRPRRRRRAARHARPREVRLRRAACSTASSSNGSGSCSRRLRPSRSRFTSAA